MPKKTTLLVVFLHIAFTYLAAQNAGQTVLGEMVQNDMSRIHYSSNFHADEPYLNLTGTMLKNSGAPLLLTDSTIIYNNFSESDSSLLHKSKFEYNNHNQLKSVTYYHQDLETDTWIEYQRAEYLYNETNEKVEYKLLSKKTSDSNWTNETRRAFDYDNTNGLIRSISEYSWNETNNNWIGSWRYEYQYDGRQNLIGLTAYSWNIDNSSWALNLREEKEYDNANRCILTVSYYRDRANNIWIGDQKSVFIYTPTGKTQKQTDFFWDQSSLQWLASFERNYTYDAESNLLGWNVKQWDRDRKIWVEWWKVDHLLDASNNTIRSDDYQWNKLDNRWDSGWKLERDYNNNQLTREAVYDWNKLEDEWNGLYQLLYLYDKNGHLSVVKDYTWHSFEGQWQLSQKRFNYMSAPDFLPVRFVISNSNGETLQNARITIGSTVYKEGKHRITGLTKGIYNAIVTAEGFETKALTFEIIDREVVIHVTLENPVSITDEEYDKNRFELFPNPASNVVMVRSDSAINIIYIYTSAGRLIQKSTPRTSEFELNVSGLSEGLYIIKSETGNKLIVSKIIIRR
ncbi:T9SS type A sorting domain-containing protein [Alkaliflexus imshenetskii]|uniref:T9SS type A sorting domain-containing protein n=1 Tax=Alkaliflexus imshenetskii TaxID=286730 RepID=UPI00047AD8B8|nr:T9SS type A sorting domain-containing protein [Alkaliflexus imshenetskii]